MNSVLGDAGLSLRMFRRSPGFVLAAVGALSLGMGTNIAIFSVVNAVLLQPLHAPHADRIVLFSVDATGSSAFASDTKFNLWLEQTSIFEQQSGYRTGSLDLTGVDQPQKLKAIFVTANYFPLFGLQLAQGRTFNAEEERPDGPPVVILSNQFWRKLGTGPSILGKSLLLGGEPHEVIGILSSAARTELSQLPDVWLPFPIDPNSTAQVHYFQGAGRLKPGVTVSMANSYLKLTTREFWRKYPDSVSTRRGDILAVQLMQDVLVKNVRSSLETLWAAVGLVLLIACANVANLLLVRATTRQREIAIRVALGATRMRIVRQLLTESALLAAIGSLLGLGFGIAGIRTLLSINAVSLPRVGVNGANVAMDWRIAAFTVIMAAVTGLLFGMIPALQASRIEVNSYLKESGGRTASGFRQNKTRSLLVIGEVSLALLLLIGSALLIRTLIALRSVDPGFNLRNVVAAEITVDPKLAGVANQDQIVQDVLRRLKSAPGVSDVALTNLLPLNGDYNSLPLIVEGRPLDGAAHGFGREMIVTPGYFGVLEIPLIRGRLFAESDRRGAPGVALINERMAHQLWPSSDPIGERLSIAKGLGPNFEESPRQIVGIVRDVHDDSLDRDPLPAVFVPAEQRPGPPAVSRPMWVVVKTRTPSQSLNVAIRNELRQSSGGLAVPPVSSMQEAMVRSTARQDFNMVVMGIFGFSALLLAAIGISGLIAYLVQQRTREIGIRLALGAERKTVRNMILRQGMNLVFAGVVIGVAAAIALSRVMESFLFGVKSRDPVVFVVALMLLGGVALFAVWVPARLASRIDPSDALRYE